MRFLLSAAVALASIAQVTAENWAVIAAGSNGYSNYRHQADACNAIKLLKAKGIPESNIITLLWDDIANNKANPFPGQIFNKPTDKGVPGEDVYAACHIDYKNPDVTADLFRAILEGNKDFVPKSGKKGKVLESTTNDRVFVFFVDHGATGLVAFPNTYLYADELVSTLEKSHANGKFKELVFYLEACEAGSMFTNLKEDIGVYATTASNAVESSWGTYCSPQDKVNGKSIGSCLGDLYSVNWLDDVWGADLNKETLEEDYITVRDKTTLSHVIQFGDLSEDTEVLKRFFASTSYVAPALRRHQNTVSDEVKILSAVESRNVRLHYLTAKYENAVTVEEKEAASVELQAEIAHRDAMDAVFSTSVRAVLNVHALTQLDQGLKVEATHFDCLRNVNKVVDEVCGRYSDYSLKYVKHVAYMCEQKVNEGMSETVAAEVIGAVIASQCANVLSL